MKIVNKIPIITLTGLMAIIPVSSKSNKHIYNTKPDTFEYMAELSKNQILNTSVIPEGGTTDPNILSKAPNPKIKINGMQKSALIAVNIKENLLFKYDKNGNPEKAYSVATGKKSTPTHPKIAIVTHKEVYPYRTAPRNSKRRRTPGAFGKFCICLNKIDPQTGKQSSTGEFIHGTNDPSSIGKKVSHGCMRLYRKDITELKDYVNPGDIVIIISGD